LGVVEAMVMGSIVGVVGVVAGMGSGGRCGKWSW